MIITEQQRIEFEEAARPLIKWLNNKCHPHVVVIIDSGRAELVEGIYSVSVEDYILD